MVTFDDLFTRDYGSAKIGVFGCGCWFYWNQFPGLKDKLIGHQAAFEDRLKAEGVEVVSGGLGRHLHNSRRAQATFSNAKTLTF